LQCTASGNLLDPDTGTVYCSPGGAASSGACTPLPAGGTVPSGKSNAELLADAAALHETVRTLYGDRAYNGTTVATGEFNGELVYTVNKNKTNPLMRELADLLGYTRVSGARFTALQQTDAEQIMLNAIDAGRLPSFGRMATSRIPCGPMRPSGRPGQDCAGRIMTYPGIELLEG
jgi:hypothetical protein